MLRNLLLPIVLVLAGAGVRAEPYIAVRTGLPCAQCHVNQTGGGLRTPVGNQYAQVQLAAFPLGGEPWTGRLGDYLGVGANVRAAETRTRTGGERQTESFDLREARLYLQASPIPERLVLYADTFVGPGKAENREGFAMWRAGDGGWHVKAGRFYLPFGWRLQDGSALVNAASAIDMAGPDLGVEAGWNPGPFALQFAVSNGTFGKRDVDSGKQYSLQGTYLEADWRVGAAANHNDQAIGARSAWGVFGGLRTGPVAWLAEALAIEDRSSTSAARRKLRSTAWLAEANWLVAQGHNLKLGVEGLDPDLDAGGDRQTRVSLVYEFTPLGFVQLRAGARRYDGPSQSAVLNRRVVFVELHGFF